MSTAAVRGVVRHLGLEAPPTDAALLTRYARHRDPAAFAELLRRHGPVVLGVCRRTLADPHAAEDAFQATFLVLARKAGSIRPAGRVGGWLYGVAVRTAQKAKVAAARRWRREMAVAASGGCEPAGSDPEPVGSALERSELRAVIDDELGRLPDRLRQPVVLCDLGGKTRSEAARELGWPEGTVAARLARARAVLAERLTRRGVALPAAGLAAVLSPEFAAAAVAPTLARSTLAAADAFGRGLASPAVSPTAQALAEGVLRAMTTGKLKLAALLVLAGGLLAGATTFWGTAAAGGPPAGRPVPKAAAPEQPRPSAGRDSGLNMTWTEQQPLDHPGWLVGSVAYSPNGKILVAGGSGRVTARDAASLKELWTTKVDGDAQHFAAVAFSADGKTIAATFADGVKFLDAETGKVGDTLEEKGSKPTAVGWFPDEAVGWGEPGLRNRKIVFDGERGYHIKNWLAWPQVGGIDLRVTPDSKPRRPVGEVPVAVDPRGKWVVLTSPIYRPTGKNELWAYSAGRGAGGEMMLGHNATVTSAAWSADGKTIVTGDTDGVVIVWDGGTFKEKARVEFEQRVAAVAVTADGKRLAAAVVQPMRASGGPVYRERVYVWNAADPVKNPPALPVAGDKVLGGPFEGTAGLTFSPDGKSLAAAFCNFTHLARSGELIGKVRVWTLTATEPKPDAKPRPEPTAATDRFREVATLKDHGGVVHSVAFAPDGKTFVTGGIGRFGADGKATPTSGPTVIEWDAGPGQLAWKKRWTSRLGGNSPVAVAYAPDGQTVAATVANGVQLLDAFNGRSGATLKLEAGDPRVVAFSPDGKWVAHSTGNVSGFRALDDSGGAAGAAVPAPGKLPASVAWSPDSLYMIYAHPTADGPGLIGMIGVTPETKPRNIIAHEGRVTAVAWSPKDNVIASGGADGQVIFWDPKATKELRRTKISGRNGSSTINALAFSPDGKTLAAAVELDAGKSVNRAVLIDVASGEQGEHLLRAGGLPVTAIAWSPDGATLVMTCGLRPWDEQRLTPDEAEQGGEVVVWARVGR
jgi:RNA polymerase sigma factor (sigma-70 family)